MSVERMLSFKMAERQAQLPRSGAEPGKCG
jgi:hypothetical protein